MNGDFQNGRPTIGITMGDPCGIGAEIIVKAINDPEVRRLARYVIFGLSEQLSYTADMLEVSAPFYRRHHEDIQVRSAAGNCGGGPYRYPHDVVVLDYDEINLPTYMPRGPSKVGGVASMRFCLDAIEAAKNGQVDALVTAPISKTSWKMAKYKKYPGHTELLARECNVKNVAMMFVAPQMKVALATIHEALFSLRDRFTIGCVFNPIELADKALRRWFGIENPRIAVAGLNPHAGEEGRFGDEENRVISPAIVMANEAGINASGPYSGDTVFLAARDGKFDCVVAMYHDQGLIPIKLLAWREAVNLTLGLPIIRTSPDHGTAFDIAGRGRADPSSMISAIKLAVELVHKHLAAEKH